MAGWWGDDYYDLYESDYSDDPVDVSDWINYQDSESNQKRSDIICKIIGNESQDELVTILECGWDVNEKLNTDDDFHDEWVGRTALHEAARQGWTEGVKMLLDAGAKCTTSDSLQNLLGLALLNRDCHPDLIELLLKQGADPNHHKRDEAIPLPCAIHKVRNKANLLIIVQLLLEHGGNPNVLHRVNLWHLDEDEDEEQYYQQAEWVNRTPVHEAAARGWTEGMKMLLDAGAKPDTSALYEAVRQGWTEVVKMLLDAGAKWMKSAELENPLALALRNCDCPPDLIELLVKQGEDPNDHDHQLGHIPLMNAIGQERSYQDYKVNPINVQLLLEHGANPNVAHRVAIEGSGETKWEYRTALHKAIQLGCTEVVKLLLDAGANYSEPGVLENPMMLALQKGKGHPDLIKLLLQHGADPNYHEADEDFPLIHAVIHWGKNLHHSKTVELLLEHGADPNVAHRLNTEGPGEAKMVKQTALYEAVRLQWTEGVKLLLDAGAKCTGADASYNLIALALHGYGCPTDLIQLLLEHGADPNDHDDQLENIPLLKAIKEDDTHYHDDQIDAVIVQLLLKHGANPNVTHQVNIGGSEETKWVLRTALYEAINRRWTEGVKMLLDAGAKCTGADASHNLIALALHNHDCSPDLIKLLLRHGADPNDHDDQLGNIPLLNVISNDKNYRTILTLLLEHGANPNVSYRLATGKSPEEVHRTALCEAARKGYIDVVKILLAAGAKCKIGASENPLALALHKSHCSPDLIELLLNHGADPNDHDDQFGNIPLLNAIEGSIVYYDHNNQVKAINMRLLLEHGANPNIAHRVNIGGHGQTKWVNRTALHKAARMGWTEGVKILLDAGAKCTMADALQNLLVLTLQDRDCHPDLIELLLKHGANPNHHEKDEDIPLPCAIHYSSNIAHLSKIVQLLLEHGANPNVLHRVHIGDNKDAKWEQRTPVHEAAARGWTEGVKMLLDAGAKCIKSVESQNPLPLALHHDDCSPDLIKLLLENGADPNDHDDQLGNIPLMNAIGHAWFNQDDKIDPINVQLLLEHGANPNVANWVNIGGWEEKWVQRSALHFAARKMATEVVKMLLDAGAKCVRSDELENPPAIALLNYDCSPDLIKLLLKHGADPNNHDKHFENVPLLKAIRKWRYDQNGETIVKQLLEHGANPNVAHQVQIHDGDDDDDYYDIRGFDPDAKWVKQTALHEAASVGWTKGVKMLLDAGAKCTTSDGLQNPLAMALKNHDCSPDLIELLLKHGADPNDHDEHSGNIPLLNAIRNGRYDQNRDIIVRQRYDQKGDINVKHLLEHGANPNVAYQVQIEDDNNDDDDDPRLFDAEAKWVQRTPLHEAARQGWTEGVKLLLDAGAKCISDGLQNPLAMALKNSDCSPNLIELLLKHGADPNDHDGCSKNIPLLNTIRNGKYKQNGEMFVKHLLEHGANPNVAHQVQINNGNDEDDDHIKQFDPDGKSLQRTAVHEAARQGWTEVVKMLLDAGAKCMKGRALENLLVLALQNRDCSPDLIEMLLKHGAEVNHTVPGEPPILHSLSRYTFLGHPMFLQRQLDLFFMHGGNINMADGALEFTVREGGHSNSVRWLIRHGAGSLPKLNLLKGHFMPHGRSCFPETPLVLLQAGMRVSHEAQTQLTNMEMALQNGLQDDNSETINIAGMLYGMWGKLEKAEERAHQGKQRTLKKSTFPEHWTRQMVDLQEFSDESLQVYPEDTYISPSNDIRQQYQKALNQVQRVLEFLSQPQSLQWYCRRSLRENLVSLQPSVVKTLPGPSRLKRYILCHEI